MDRRARRRGALPSPRRPLRALGGAVLAGALLLAGCASGGPGHSTMPPQAGGALPAETVGALEAAVTEGMSAAAASGAIVGVWVPWSGSWVAGLGEDADGEPVHTDMAFRAGDLTRPMTCDVLYALAADGVVGLDDPVSQYIAGYATLKDVTLVELCNGTSGLGSFGPALESSWVTNPERRWSPSEIASYGIGAGLTHDPGSVYDGSDTGYVLLGKALENAADASAAELLEEHVFDPLGLGHTVLPGAAPAPPRASGPSLKGYLSAPAPDGAEGCAAPEDVSVRSASSGYTDGGVVSTVEDMGRYLRALAAGTHAGLDERNRWADPLPAAADAPGWYTATGGALQAGPLRGQFGSQPGYLSAGFADPETGLTVVVVLNNSTASEELIGSLAWELAALASAAPAAEGFTVPQFGLPWTAEQFHQAVADAAVCR